MESKGWNSLTSDQLIALNIFIDFSNPSPFGTPLLCCTVPFLPLGIAAKINKFNNRRRKIPESEWFWLVFDFLIANRRDSIGNLMAAFCKIGTFVNPLAGFVSTLLGIAVVHNA